MPLQGGDGLRTKVILSVAMKCHSERSEESIAAALDPSLPQGDREGLADKIRLNGYFSVRLERCTRR